MSIQHGSLSLRRLLVLGPVPGSSDLEEGLELDRYRPFEDGLEEERLGWCDWRNPLYSQDSAWLESAGEGWSTFALRIDTRKVPGGLLKAHVEERLSQLMKERDLAFVGKEARTTISDEVKADLLRQVLPSMKTYTVCWNLKRGVVLTDASSSKVMSALMGLMMKSFGVEMQLQGPLLLAGALLPDLPTESLMALDPLDLSLEEA